MPISGIVLALDADTGRRAAALARLQRHPHVQVGQQEALRLPIVVDVPDEATNRQLWQWLHELDGVQFVDLVYVHFDGDSRLVPADSASSQQEETR